MRLLSQNLLQMKKEIGDLDKRLGLEEVTADNRTAAGYQLLRTFCVLSCTPEEAEQTVAPVADDELGFCCA
jgi:hypothetical protein